MTRNTTTSMNPSPNTPPTWWQDWPDWPQAALAFVLQAEGGYSNDPRDPGGETKFGISKRAFPELDVASLTREQAVAIYRERYWRPLMLDELPGALALAVMDAGVNRGVVYAARLLQTTLNRGLARVGGRPESLSALAVDGKVGPKTLAVARALAHADPEGRELAARFNLARVGGYVELAGREKFRPFLLGWLRRVVALSELCDGFKPRIPPQSRNLLQ